MKHATAFNTQIGHTWFTWSARIREVLRNEDLELDAIVERFGVSRVSAHRFRQQARGLA